MALDRVRAANGRASGPAHPLRRPVRAGPAAAARALVAVLGFGAASALAALACDRPAAVDQGELEKALAADVATSKALKRVDDASHTPQALDILKRDAVPAADEALREAQAFEPRTSWGKTEKLALVSLANDRKSEMAAYEHALASGSDEETLAVLTKQVEIEQRATNLMQEVERGP